MLSRDSKKQDYELAVRWTSNKKGDVLFNSYDTTLKFLVDKAKIFTFAPVKRPKIVSFNLNSNFKRNWEMERALWKILR